MRIPGIGHGMAKVYVAQGRVAKGKDCALWATRMTVSLPVGIVVTIATGMCQEVQLMLNVNYYR